jgi:predicted ATPase
MTSAGMSLEVKRVIKEIEIEGFKSLMKVHLELGGLNLFIGANASGKSNFFDALRVLQGIGYGFTIEEVFNGKPKGAGSEVWEGIRGGLSRAAFRGKRGSFQRVRPEIGFWVRNKRRLTLNIYPTKPETSASDYRVFNFSDFANMQQMEIEPVILRQYSHSQTAQRLGDRGENFAALVKAILADDDLRSAYLSWLRQLTPMELDDVTILEGALGEPLFALKEGEEILPAPILSDGTLRFAAITAAFFQPDMPSIITLEEIENGMHPSRLRLLVELLKSQTRGSSGPQVFATTHSPVVLAWLDEEDYKTTFLCRRDQETGASIITPLSEIPHLIDLVRKQPIGELFTEGWLEGAF